MAGMSLWPDYCKRETLAKRLNLPAGAIDQLVTRGLLPQPLRVGEVLLWRWADVDAWISGAQSKEEPYDDPYLSSVGRSREAATSRPQGEKQVR